MTERRLISSGSAFEADIGYSRAIVTGSWVIISGTTGYDHSTTPAFLPPTITTQCTQALQNIQFALLEARSSIQDVVRVRYILPDAKMFPECWPILKEWFEDVRPAATMIQAGLMKEEMLIEIEVTARKRGKMHDENEEGDPA